MAPKGTGPGTYPALEEIVKAGADGRRGPAPRSATMARIVPLGDGYFLHSKISRRAMLFLLVQRNSTPKRKRARMPRQATLSKQRFRESSFLSLFSLTTNTALPYTSCNIIASPCEAGL